MSAAPALLVLHRCNFCSKELPGFRVHRLAGGAQIICDDCVEWHIHALNFQGGKIPPGCQECRASWEFLRDSTPGVEIRMYVVPRDGILQLLCSTCVQRYLPKRADLYRGTAFGERVLKV